MTHRCRTRIIPSVILVVFAALASQPARAGSLDFNLSGDAAEVGYARVLERFDPGTATVGGSLLYNDRDDFVGTVGFAVTGNPFGGSDRVRLGAAIRFYGAVLDTRRDDRGAAVALGVGAGYRFTDDVPVRIDGWLLGAPGITSFSDIDGVREVGVRVGIDVVEGARIYAGYRFLEFDRDNRRDREVDDALHAGVTLSW